MEKMIGGRMKSTFTKQMKIQVIVESTTVGVELFGNKTHGGLSGDEQ